MNSLALTYDFVKNIDLYKKKKEKKIKREKEMDKQKAVRLCLIN